MLPIVNVIDFSTHHDFMKTKKSVKNAKLQVLDLSYNNLSQEDILKIGLLPNLKVLHLTGNGFRTLPQNMGMPHIDTNRYVLICTELSCKAKCLLKAMSFFKKLRI